ncbi:hypothetical protein Ciccas_013395 [Cichlidogyrus casuarinus]|uniref:Uncharacterized protein n=1 Tax=Cichlidogyrus casuarinus TaxID=1844966 RepID=A0ABD2PMI1_9PLAT
MRKVSTLLLVVCLYGEYNLDFNKISQASPGFGLWHEFCVNNQESCSSGENCCENFLCYKGFCEKPENILEPIVCSKKRHSCLKDQDCCKGLVCNSPGICAKKFKNYRGTMQKWQCSHLQERCEEDRHCCKGFLCGEEQVCVPDNRHVHYDDD